MCEALAHAGIVLRFGDCVFLRPQDVVEIMMRVSHLLSLSTDGTRLSRWLRLYKHKPKAANSINFVESATQCNCAHTVLRSSRLHTCVPSTNLVKGLLQVAEGQDRCRGSLIGNPHLP